MATIESQKIESESTRDVLKFWKGLKSMSLATDVLIMASDDDNRIHEMHEEAFAVLRDMYFSEVDRRAEEVKKQRAKMIKHEMLFITVKYSFPAYQGEKDYAEIGNAVSDALINYSNRLYNDGYAPWTTSMEEVITEDNTHITIQRGTCNDEKNLPLPKVERVRHQD
ncbi:hypothetical protein EN46_06750 [Citrobacter amalonaticus]